MKWSKRAVQSGRLGQSAQTGFVHLYAGEFGGDTIPIYENFCFALALISQKTIEGVSEGKDLFERLLAFQVEKHCLWKGNFPLYLHDYPRCWSVLQPLKIAPLFIRLLNDWEAVLEGSFIEKVKRALDDLLSCAEKIRETKSLSSLWERRYFALLGKKIEMLLPSNSEDASQELITAHLLQEPLDFFAGLIHPDLLVYNGPSSKEMQEGFEPRLSLIEAWAGGFHGDTRSPQLLELSALSEKMAYEPSQCFQKRESSGWLCYNVPHFALRFVTQSEEEGCLLDCKWKEDLVYSLCLSVMKGIKSVSCKTKEGVEFLLNFSEIGSSSTELAFFLNYSKDTSIWIEQKKATAFSLKDTVFIQTPSLKTAIRFEVIQGEGDFYGQVSRSNRPTQIKHQGTSCREAFDWKIAIRTLRRSKNIQLKVRIEFFHDSFVNDALSTAIPMACSPLST